MTCTNLGGANLSGADLTKTWLEEADLLEANLTGANLTEANLTGANLNKANLSGANLMDVDLSFANLEMVRFWKDVRWRKTNIFRVNNAPEGFVDYVLDQGGMVKEPHDIPRPQRGRPRDEE